MILLMKMIRWNLKIGHWVKKKKKKKYIKEKLKVLEYFAFLEKYEYR